MAKQPVFKDGQVLRFSTAARVLHTVHLLSFFTLLYTGLARLWPETNVLLGGDLLLGQTIHHLAAVVFIAVPVALALLYPRGALHFLKTLFSWDKDDTRWMIKFIPWMIRPQAVKLPPQGQEKAGQKVSAWIIIGFCLLIAVSGGLMWIAQFMPSELMKWMYAIHDVSMIILLFVIVMHIYMGVLFPATRRSWTSMITGYVPEEEARHGWRKWYDDLKKGQQTV
jgi:formate dehydrogenase subunit gamma